MSKFSHLAIILDGNGRWATKLGKSRLEGHREGAKKVITLLQKVIETDINYLTLYALSSENFKRNSIEVNNILYIIQEYLLTKILPFAQDNNIKIKFIGSKKRLSENCINTFNLIEGKTSGLTKLNLIIAVDYGGRNEVIHAINKLIDNNISTNIDYNDLEKHLYTSGLPDPDLIVRYGGEKRLSNFLPLQSIYTELKFEDKFWPDFKKSDIDKFIEYFNKIKRNYGGVNEE